jgi:hypothetical protein
MKTLSVRRFVLYAALTLTLIAGFARPSSAFLDKTRFAAHLGVAYFCFHHWVLAPVQHGEFSNGAPHRVATMVKGGAALLFAVHEVKVSEKIARNSNSPLLHKMDGKLVALAGTFAAVGTSLKAGHFAPDDIKGLSSSTDSVSSDAAAAGQPIKDVPIPSIGSPNATDTDSTTQ